MRSYSSSRRCALSCLESFRPLIGVRPGGKTTAATTTGPASGPRPASSTPAKRAGGAVGSAVAGSKDMARGLCDAPTHSRKRGGRVEQFGDGVGRARGGVTAQREVELAEAGLQDQAG